MTYAILGTCVLCISQIAYSLLFVLLFMDHTPSNRWRYRVYAFLLMLPFAQVVPALVCINSYNFAWFQRLLKWIGLDDDPVSRESSHLDPLKNYLMDKLMTHGTITHTCRS